MKNFKTYLLEGGDSESNFEAAAEIGFVADKKTSDSIAKFYEYSRDPKFQNELWDRFNKAWDNISSLMTKGGFDFDDEDVFIDMIDMANPVYKKVHKKTKKKVRQEALEIMSIIAGVYEFKKDVLMPILGKDLGFVHKDVTGYYEWEKEVIGIQEGSKENTSDIIVTSKKNVPILKKIIKEKDKSISVESDLTNGFVNLKKGGKVLCKYFQVSLKKAKGDSQLGNVNKLVSMLYGQKSATDIATSLTANYKTFGKALQEGLLSNIISKVKGFVLDKIGQLNKFFQKLFSSIKEKFLSITKISSDDVKKALREVGIDGVLEEAKRAEGKKVKDVTKNTLTKLFKNISNVISVTEKKINEVKKLANDTNVLVIHTPIKNKGPFKPGDFTGKSPIKDVNRKGNATLTTYRLIGNVSTLDKLKLIITQAKTDIESFKSAFVGEITAETIYGGSKLPIWVVYGKDFVSGEKSYNYIESRNKSIEKTVGLINNKKFLKNLPVVGVMIQGDQKLLGKHYTIKLFILKEIKEEKGEPRYVYINYKTGSHFSTKFSDVFNARGYTYIPFSENPLDSLKSEMDKSK